MTESWLSRLGRWSLARETDEERRYRVPRRDEVLRGANERLERGWSERRVIAWISMRASINGFRAMWDDTPSNRRWATFYAIAAWFIAIMRIGYVLAGYPWR